MEPDAPHHPAWRRVLLFSAKAAGILIAAAGALAVVLATGLLLLLWSCQPPSVNSLASRFEGKRPDLEKILEMSDQDAQLSVIDPTWLMKFNGPQFVGYSAESGISLQRWEEYRRIFGRVGATQGIRRSTPKGDVFIIIKSFGILENGASAGYLYCASGAEHKYAPCSSNEKSGKHPYAEGNEAYEFVRVADYWYAYSQGPG